MPTVSLEPATYADAVYVARRLRPNDSMEILPLLHGGAEDLAFSAAGAHYNRTALHDGKPVAVVGATQIVATCWQVFMFATHEWPQVSLSVTRHIVKEMLPTLYDAGANRAECRTHADYDYAHRWLEMMGARREAVIPEYGREAATYYQYVWLRSETKV